MPAMSCNMVAGEAAVIFDPRRYGELEARQPLANRFLCTRKLRKRGEEHTVVPFGELTLKQQCQSQLWGSRGSVLPSHIGVIDRMEVVLQVLSARVSQLSLS
jgi:hypothetical protein